MVCIILGFYDIIYGLSLIYRHSNWTCWRISSSIKILWKIIRQCAGRWLYNHQYWSIRISTQQSSTVRFKDDINLFSFATHINQNVVCQRSIMLTPNLWVFIPWYTLQKSITLSIIKRCWCFSMFFVQRLQTDHNSISSV